MSDEELAGFGVSRRDFFKKMIALGFAVPVVSSFALDGVASAEDWDHDDDHGQDHLYDHFPHPHHSRGNSTYYYRPNSTSIP